MVLIKSFVVTNSILQYFNICDLKCYLEAGIHFFY